MDVNISCSQHSVLLLLYWTWVSCMFFPCVCFFTVPVRSSPRLDSSSSPTWLPALTTPPHPPQSFFLPSRLDSHLPLLRLPSADVLPLDKQNLTPSRLVSPLFCVPSSSVPPLVALVTSKRLFLGCRRNIILCLSRLSASAVIEAARPCLDTHSGPQERRRRRTETGVRCHNPTPS